MILCILLNFILLNVNYFYSKNVTIDKFYILLCIAIENYNKKYKN